MKCEALVSLYSGIIMIVGEAESGKSYMLGELYKSSKADVKIFHGGIATDERQSMLEYIAFRINNSVFTNNTIEIYLDEFDDSKSLDFIYANFISDGIKVIITTKYPSSYFEKYVDIVEVFHIESKKLSELMLLCIQYDKELENDLLQLQTGDWLHIVNLKIKKIDCEVLNNVIVVKSDKLKKKESSQYSMNIMQNFGQRIVTIYDDISKEQTVNT